jgi:hypothetical protein
MYRLCTRRYERFDRIIKIADKHARWQQEMQPLLADVCRRHPTISSAQPVDGEEAELCMDQCIEVMKYICDGQKVLADPALVITADSRSKLSQLVKDPQDDVNRMLDAIHEQLHRYQQSQQPDAAIKQSDATDDASATASTTSTVQSSKFI